VIESYDEVGYNYRMTDLQAALRLVQLQRLEICLPETGAGPALLIVSFFPLVAGTAPDVPAYCVTTFSLTCAAPKRCPYKPGSIECRNYWTGSILTLGALCNSSRITGTAMRVGLAATGNQIL